MIPATMMKSLLESFALAMRTHCYVLKRGHFLSVPTEKLAEINVPMAHC